MQYVNDLQEMFVSLAPLWLIAAGVIITMLLLALIIAVAAKAFQL